LIVAKIAAINDIGTGPYSDENVDGIYVQTEPVAPSAAPVLVASDTTYFIISMTE
jgi:hypothetical protein